MSAAANKQLMQQIFEGLSRGDGAAFRDSLADDFCWTIMGSTKWSGVYRGKTAVFDQLLKPLFAQFADRYTSVAHRIIADDRHVVVECSGKVTTKSGKPYNNSYCWVCRIEDGRLRELTEYLDTELVATALDPPPGRP